MATAFTHQTVRLAPGSHARPEDGACVMELASMLAGERFSDRPRAVCPAIGMFLRHYNDRVDEQRRQDLYEIAALVVGTAGGRRMTRQRRRACADALAAAQGRRRSLRWPGAVEVACAEDFVRRGAHQEALMFVRRLAAMGTPGLLGPIPHEKEEQDLVGPGRPAHR